ncbi:MAG: DUF1330 domain-containing protein [Bryobacteraceae bacterium]|nr:DUF1330 domain-containing protein [Bryobacteraceae bacterium]
MKLIVIAQLHVRAGKRRQFDEFERQALAIVARHGGELLHALQPILVVPADGLPDEVHILSFPSEAAFAAYRADPELLALASLRAEAIAATQILMGKALA